MIFYSVVLLLLATVYCRLKCYRLSVPQILFSVSEEEGPHQNQTRLVLWEVKSYSLQAAHCIRLCSSSLSCPRVLCLWRKTAWWSLRGKSEWVQEENVNDRAHLEYVWLEIFHVLVVQRNDASQSGWSKVQAWASPVVRWVRIHLPVPETRAPMPGPGRSHMPRGT